MASTKILLNAASCEQTFHPKRRSSMRYISESINKKYGSVSRPRNISFKIAHNHENYISNYTESLVKENPKEFLESATNRSGINSNSVLDLNDCFFGFPFAENKAKGLESSGDGRILKDFESMYIKSRNKNTVLANLDTFCDSDTTLTDSDQDLTPLEKNHSFSGLQTHLGIDEFTSIDNAMNSNLDKNIFAASKVQQSPISDISNSSTQISVRYDESSGQYGDFYRNTGVNVRISQSCIRKKKSFCVYEKIIFDSLANEIDHEEIYNNLQEPSLVSDKNIPKMDQILNAKSICVQNMDLSGFRVQEYSDQLIKNNTSPSERFSFTFKRSPSKYSQTSSKNNSFYSLEFPQEYTEISESKKRVSKNPPPGYERFDQTSFNEFKPEKTQSDILENQRYTENHTFRTECSQTSSCSSIWSNDSSLTQTNVETPCCINSEMNFTLNQTNSELSHIDFQNSINAFKNINLKKYLHDSSRINPPRIRFGDMSKTELFDNLIDAVTDQYGCRCVQRLIEQDLLEYMEIIYTKTKNHFTFLMMDPYGNYFCQKFLEFCTDQMRTNLVEIISKDIEQIALDIHGTRALQKLIVYSKSSPAQVSLIIENLKPCLIGLIKDLNGNHVVQKVLSSFKPDECQFIYDSVSTNFLLIAGHRHGCCVLQRCIDRSSQSQLDTLISNVLKNILVLVKDPFGNYVIQYILNMKDLGFLNSAISLFSPYFISLSKHKFGSNVVEKCIKVSYSIIAGDLNKEALGKDNIHHGAKKKYPSNMYIEKLVSSIMNHPSQLESLIKDPYGNYVVQTLLDYSHVPLRYMIMKTLTPMVSSIRNTAHGKRILSKMSAYGFTN
ncbi:Pumilio domain-containing protein [Smittium mucronatum]|uniref:Pumilio domain-containing protein n=1 Tax=Smittium mucronatum TaxID=133383 RepID=A0A1R0GUX3_9FUNG|nr:Pumilio domain-containing protein [Smittium mucronatum]